MAGSIELAGHQFGMPTKDCIRFDDRRNGLQRLSSELLTDCGKLSPFFVLESKLTFFFDRSIRFSVTRYSLRSLSSSSTEPVTLASSFVQDMNVSIIRDVQKVKVTIQANRVNKVVEICPDS